MLGQKGHRLWDPLKGKSIIMKGRQIPCLENQLTHSEKYRMYMSYLHYPNMVKEILSKHFLFFSFRDSFNPGTTQMTQKDILYRLQSSKAKCISTNDVLAPSVDGVASKCENLHSKLIVSQSPREGWEKWVAIIVVEQLPKKKRNIDKIVNPWLTRKMKIKTIDKGNNWWSFLHL